MRSLFALLGVVLIVPHLGAQSSVTMCADDTRAKTGDAAPCVGHGGVAVHTPPPAAGSAADNPWLKPNPMDSFMTTMLRTQRKMEDQSRDAAARRNEAGIQKRNAAKIAFDNAAPSAADMKKAAATEHKAGLASAASSGVSGTLSASGSAKKTKSSPPGTITCRDLTHVPISAGSGACAGHGDVAARKP